MPVPPIKVVISVVSTISCVLITKQGSLENRIGYLGSPSTLSNLMIIRISETALHDTRIVNTCHYIFVQTNRMYNTKSEP